jgi:hypothetical protein
MRNNSPTFNLSNDAAGGFKPLQQGLQLWWYRMPAGVRSPVWPNILGALIIVGMLLAFHQVVHGAVQQSALRHKASAVHGEATQRCNALQGQGASDNCRLQLNAAYDGINTLSRSQ